MVTRTRKPALLNSSGLKSAFKKLRFRDAIVWTVRLTEGKKPRFQISPVPHSAMKKRESCHKIISFFSGLVRNNFDCLNLGVHSFTNNIGAVTSHRFPCSGRRYHTDNR